jgi:hypothetical protein
VALVLSSRTTGIDVDGTPLLAATADGRRVDFISSVWSGAW